MIPRPIIVIAFGSVGDVYPMAALAHALQQAGHELSFMTASLHAPWVRRLGLRFVPLDTTEKGTLEMDRPNAYRAFSQLWHRIGQAAAQTLAHVGAELRAADAVGGPRPLLVASTLAVGARLAQEAHGLRLATVHMSPSCFLSSLEPPAFRDMALPAAWPLPFKRLAWWLVETIWLDPICKHQLDPLHRSLGLPPARRIMGRWIHSPDLALGLFPAWFCAPQADWPQQARVTGFPLADQAEVMPLDAGLEDFLAAGPAPLVFTTGSSMRQARRFFTDAVEVCRQLGRRGLLLTRHAGQLPSLPHFMHHLAYAPLSKVLPRACALVSHGGIGTCSLALRAGVPQLMLPYAHDQFDNARLFARLGVGMVLGPDASAERMVVALRELLGSEAVAAACRAAQQQMLADGPGIARACRAVQSMLAPDTPPPNLPVP